MNAVDHDILALQRCGLVQPITVAEGHELNEAMREAREAMRENEERNGQLTARIGCPMGGGGAGAEDTRSANAEMSIFGIELRPNDTYLVGASELTRCYSFDTALAIAELLAAERGGWA